MVLVASSCEVSGTKGDVNDARKSRCAYISTRRWPKREEESPAGLDDVADSSNNSTYPLSMLLRARAAESSAAAINPTVPAYMVRHVSDLPGDFQAPEWKQRNPTPAADPRTTTKQRFSSPCKGREQENAVRAILNTLTGESKFEELLEQLVTSGIHTLDDISMLMTEVFDKATTQHHFIPMYADLCGRLEKDSHIMVVAGSLTALRRLLLNQCQSALESLFAPSAGEHMPDEEVTLSRKQQALGKMKLIGHLLVKGMLTSEMLVQYAEELVSKRESCPEALEALAALLMVAGPVFDNPAWPHHPRLQELLADLRKVTKSKSTPPRARHILRDVLDVRDAGWPNSKKESRNFQIEQPDLTSANGAPEAPAVIQLDLLLDSSSKYDVDASDIVSTPCKADDKIILCLDNALLSDDQLDASLFDVVTFRRILAVVLADLITTQDIADAVNRIRLQQVPLPCQADQVVDILTRVLEEKRGPHRRRAIAFLTGLAASEQSAFDRKTFLDGIDLFFRDVYNDLCHEVPRLTSMISTELIPVLLSVFTKSEINGVLPSGFYCPGLRAP